MADRKFSQFTAGLTNQSSTDTLVGLDLSQPASAQNTFWTLNNLFSVITRNIADGALRFGAFAAPTISGAGAGSIYFDSSSNTFKVSENAGAYTDLTRNNAAPSFATLTDAATVTWAFSASQQVGNARVVLGGNRTLSITGIAAGATGLLVITQDGTGGRTLALPAGSVVVNGGGGAVTLTATPGAVDLLSFVYDGTTFYWTIGNNYD